MTSYRLHFSPISWMCTSACPVILQWLLDGNSHLPPSTLLLPGRIGWRSWSLTTSVPTGPTILHLIQIGCCFVACFSLMRTGQNTCLLVFTLLATIYHWFSLELSGEAVDTKYSFSVMNNWTQWRRPCPHYGSQCVVAKRLLGSQVRKWCLPVGFDTQSANGSSIRRFTVHFSNFTRYRISLAHV